MSRKVGIIGCGHVGAHVLYTIALMGIADDFIVVDIDEKKANADRQDLIDSMQFLPGRVSVKLGSYENLGDRDVIVNCSGKISLLIGTTTRLAEMQHTLPTVRSYVDRIKASGFNGIFVNITNPCDIITKEFADRLGLPKGHVLGTGTGLDTARLITRIADSTGLDAHSIQAYMFGEHGNSQFAPWSIVRFNGLPLDIWEATHPDKKLAREELSQAAAQGGWITFQGKHSTEFAIALTAARTVRAILNDAKKVMPVSAELTGEYGESGLFAGVPAVIGKDGVEEVPEFPLTEEELKRFHECCDGIREKIELGKSGDFDYVKIEK